MKRTLNAREKRLLLFCLGAIFIVANLLVYNEFNKRLKATTSTTAELNEQVTENENWLVVQDIWEKRGQWLDERMPFTASTGRSQGQLLEYLQTSALDSDLRVTNQTLLEPVDSVHGKEVAVNVRVRGDQDKVLRWLLGLQAPESFQAVKSIEIELDSRAREKVPQAQCNLTVARWFNLKPPPQTAPRTAPVGAPVTPSILEPDPPAPADTPINPLDVDDPLEA